MKSFTIRECRKCNAKFLDEEERVIIDPGEEVEILIMTVAKCKLCQLLLPRSASVSKTKLPRA